MKVHYWDENLPPWSKSLMWWKFINVIRINKYNENSIEMKFDQFGDLHICDEKSWLWWKFITVIEINHCDENYLMWWELIGAMKVHNWNENSSIWYIFIILMKTNYDESSVIWWNSHLWWKFITEMKIYQCVDNSRFKISLCRIEF